MVDWHSLFATVKPYVPPYFFGTLAASAFGAFAGAWAASRSQTKRAVVAELNSVRAALALCFSISNRFVSFKKQHIKDFYDRYKAVQQAHLQHLAAAAQGAPPQVFALHADLQTITPVKVPTDVLQRQVFEKISISGRALAVAVDLIGAIDGLEASIKYRNELVAEFQKASPIPVRTLLEKYLGVQNADGAIDERVGGNVTAIYCQTDDCIFFSRILADDLFEYGRKLRRRYAWRFRLGTPKFRKADWSEATQAGLIPPDDLYKDWLKGFKKDETIFVRIRNLLCKQFATVKQQ